MYNGSIYNPYATPAVRQEVITVNGRNGAEAYQMAPNSSILLLDETAPIVWLKTTDGASYPTVTGYTITPIKAKIMETPDTKELFMGLEERIKKLEELVNAKSDVIKVKTSKSSPDKQ